LLNVINNEKYHHRSIGIGIGNSVQQQCLGQNILSAMDSASIQFTKHRHLLRLAI